MATIEVEIPGEGIAEFPEETTPDQIKGALQKRFYSQPVTPTSPAPKSVMRRAAELGSSPYSDSMTLINPDVAEMTSGSEPITPIPKIPQQEGTVKQVGAAVVNAASGAVDALQTPTNLQLAPALGVPGLRQAISGMFAAKMFSDIPEQVRQAEAQPTIQKKLEGGLGAITSLLFAGGAMKGAMEGIAPVSKMQETLSPIIGKTEQPALASEAAVKAVAKPETPTQQAEIVSLEQAARQAKTSDEFIGAIQRSALDAEQAGKDIRLDHGLLTDIQNWATSTPENQARFKNTGWFGIASEYFDEAKAKPVIEGNAAPVESGLRAESAISNEQPISVPPVEPATNPKPLGAAERAGGTESISKPPIAEPPSGTGEAFLPPEGQQMRKSAERATTSEMVPEPVQETIKTAPESFYTPQSMRSVEQRVSQMAEPDLAAVPRESEVYTAAKLEQAKRHFDKGENDAGYNVFVELEKEGTRLGQLINQFKFLTSSRPEHVVTIVNKGLEKAGKDRLNPEQAQRAVDTSRKATEADNALNSATAEWVKNPTPENAAKAEQALTEANGSALELQQFVSKFQPRTTSQVLKSVLQGNLLTPISEVANLVGNVSFLPFRAAGRSTAAVVDVIDSAIRNKPREVSVSPITGTKEAVKGVGRGLAKIPEIVVRGTGDTIKGETRVGLHPVRAWINQFAKNPEMPTTGGKLTLRDRVNLAIEGTFGAPAEVMLRGLGAGDMPFREAARARVITNEAKLASVPTKDLGMAQKFPELFFDDATMQRIRSETVSAIFQRNSGTLNHITNWIRGKGDVFDLAIATIAPYKLTPWNIVGEILSYNPLIALGRTAYEAKAGTGRAAKVNAGKFAVGSMLTGASWWLYQKGLVAPSMDQRDEAQKARVLAGEILPPNHLNLGGLQRALMGGDSSFKSGDKTVDIFRAGGLAGAFMYMTANIGRDFERTPEMSNNELWGAILRQSSLEQARFGMNQSFVSGIEGFLTAVKDGNADSYIQKWANTATAIPLPNSMVALSRATREFRPETKGDNWQDKLKNLVASRFGAVGTDDYLPLKRGLWGEPLRETPEGRNSLIYQFFDVTKGKQVTSDPVPLELYRLWRKTGDTKVIPSLPERSITVARQTYNLSQEQRSRYAEFVGIERRRITEALVVNPNWHAVADEQKIKVLDSAYRKGQETGKALFWQEAQGNLAAKSQRAGFAVQ